MTEGKRMHLFASTIVDDVALVVPRRAFTKINFEAANTDASGDSDTRTPNEWPIR